MPYLQMAYLDASGTPHPAAIVEVDGLHLELTHDHIAGDIKISIYHDLPSHDAGLPPFEERPFTPLSAAEIAALESQFRTAIYQILQQRPEFASATLVPDPPA